MQVGMSAAWSLSQASLGVGAPISSGYVPQNNNVYAGFNATQALTTAQALQGFFTMVLGGQVASPYTQVPMAQMGASLFGVAGSWATPAFASMGPSYGGLAPGAQYNMMAAGAAMSGSMSLAAVFSLAGSGYSRQASMSAAARIEEDPYGISQSGQGVKSNLANSPEVMLAIQASLKEGKSQSYEDLAKSLKEDFGIEAEVGDIKVKDKEGKEVSAKGIKFGNGDYFVDGNGNGQLEAADYKFGDAVKALKEKYNLQDEDLTRITDRMKSQAKNPTPSYQGYQGLGAPQALQNVPPLLYNQQDNYGWMMLFVQAFQMAAAG